MTYRYMLDLRLTNMMSHMAKREWEASVVVDIVAGRSGASCPMESRSNRPPRIIDCCSRHSGMSALVNAKSSASCHGRGLCVGLSMFSTSDGRNQIMGLIWFSGLS